MENKITPKITPPLIQYADLTTINLDKMSKLQLIEFIKSQNRFYVIASEAFDLTERENKELTAKLKNKTLKLEKMRECNIQAQFMIKALMERWAE